jgi:hypothetical protein
MVKIRKIRKTILNVLATCFIVYNLYLFVMIKVLNIVSINSQHTVHSKSLSDSKRNGYFLASYKLDNVSTPSTIIDSLIPGEIFIEKERVCYELYYLYWGKTLPGKGISVDASEFNKLSDKGEYFYCSPTSLSGCINGLDPLDKYNKNLYFSLNTIPDSIIISVFEKGDFNNPTMMFIKNTKLQPIVHFLTSGLDFTSAA